MNQLVIFSLIATTCIYCGLSVSALLKKRTPASRFFAAMVALAAIWAATYAGEIGATALLTKIRFLQIRLLFICFIPFAWLGLVLALTGRFSAFKKTFIVLLLIVPFITAFFSITTLMHDHFRYDFAIKASHGLNLLVYKRSHWDLFHEASNHLVSLLGFFILIGAWHSSSGTLHKQITLLAISFIIPLSFNLLFVSHLIPALGINPTPFVLLPGSFLQAWVVLRSRILDMMPSAWPMVLDHVGVGIIVLDSNDSIVSINLVAQALTGTEESRALGYPPSDLPTPWNTIPLAETNRTDPIHLQKNGTSRWIGVERIHIGKNNASSGNLILLQDVTADVVNRQKAELERQAEEQRRQLRLQKLLLRDIHDGLGGLASNLSMMSVLAEKEKDLESKNNWLHKIEQSAAEINVEIRDLMSALETTSMNWSELISSIRHTANILFDPAIMTVAFHIGGIPDTGEIGFAEGMSIARMARECMNNIVKHAQASQVVVNITVSPEQFTIAITDNGCGFNPETVQAGRGLKNLAKRSSELGGHYETIAGSGTKQTITIPVPLRIVTNIET